MMKLYLHSLISLYGVVIKYRNIFIFWGPIKVWTVWLRFVTMRWERNVARKGENRNSYRILVGKPDGKNALGRPKHSWVDNIN
jgi:hypothetical protein